jgi:pimeloyl-ACP methyl ester carboxylesterase
MSQSDPAVKNVVLVHGAWADGSSWSGVIQRLQRAGYKAVAVQVALNSFTDDVTLVRRVLGAQAGPTILVGHSFGGAIITGLGADAPHVVGLVYVAAFAPDKGESMKGLIGGGPQPAGTTAIRPDANGLVWLDPGGFVKYFAPDLDPVQAQVLAAVQKPIAAGEIFDDRPLGDPAWKFFPTWYLLTEQDQMIPPGAQRFMAQRAKATILSVASSHVAMISHPEATTTLIETAAAGAKRP